MNHLKTLITKVEHTRDEFISEASGLSFLQSEFKPSPDVWSIKDVVEHIVRAENAGVFGMWRALKAKQAGNSIWEGKNVNKGLTIEEVVEKTWKPKEKVPEIARPHWGGPVEFWIASLQSYRHTLSQLEKELSGQDPELIIYPHPISGPLNVFQRMEFLRFHMQRHQNQMKNLKIHPEYPK